MNKIQITSCTLKSVSFELQMEEDSSPAMTPLWGFLLPGLTLSLFSVETLVLMTKSSAKALFRRRVGMELWLGGEAYKRVCKTDQVSPVGSLHCNLLMSAVEREILLTLCQSGIFSSRRCPSSENISSH